MVLFAVTPPIGRFAAKTTIEITAQLNKEYSFKLDCNSECSAPIGFVCVGGQTLSDGRFRGNAPDGKRFTVKLAPTITAQLNKEYSFVKLDCNSEGFAPIGFVCVCACGGPNPIGGSFSR